VDWLKGDGFASEVACSSETLVNSYQTMASYLKTRLLDGGSVRVLHIFAFPADFEDELWDVIKQRTIFIYSNRVLLKQNLMSVLRLLIELITKLLTHSICMTSYKVIPDINRIFVFETAVTRLFSLFLL